MKNGAKNTKAQSTVPNPGGSLNVPTVLVATNNSLVKNLQVCYTL